MAILDAPVGGISDMGDPRESVEGDVALMCVTAEHAQRAPAQLACGFELALEIVHCLPRSCQQAADLRIGAAIRVGLTPLLDFGQAVA
jgi:hypothetical protein